MIRLGLVGYPLDHSLSPKIHTAALRSCGLQGVYSLFPIAPDDPQGLHKLLTRLRTGEITGLNVTIPHKQNIVPLLDELTPKAKAIHAVNTLYRRDDKLIGDNTDAPGFLIDLNNFLDDNWSKIGKQKSSIVLGAGGSARAVAFALINDGWTVSIVARRVEQAQQLAASFPGHPLEAVGYSRTNFDLSNISLIVNTTPVGMAPDMDHSPWPEDWPFPPRAAVYDLVYHPYETRFVKDACAAGCPARAGLGMLIEQAALAFEIWTGVDPSREIMFGAVSQTAH